MINALDPDLMTATERLSEVATILAIGLSRLKKRQGSSSALGRRMFGLDISVEQSMCGQPVANGEHP